MVLRKIGCRQGAQLSIALLCILSFSPWRACTGQKNTIANTLHPPGVVAYAAHAIGQGVAGNISKTSLAEAQTWLTRLDQQTEHAVYELSIEGDPRPLEAISLLSPVSDPNEGWRWRWFSETFESPTNAYHVRTSHFFDLDLHLQPKHWSRSFISWESGACCEHDRQTKTVLPRSENPSFRLAQMPLLVRWADLAGGPRHIDLAFPDGHHAAAALELVGCEQWEGPEGPVQAERIAVRYPDADARFYLDAAILGGWAVEEHYWRSADQRRILLGMETSYWDRKLQLRLRSLRLLPILEPALRRAMASPTIDEQSPPSRGTEETRTVLPGQVPRSFYSDPRWDDGKAELAFYELEEGRSPKRLALQITVKHRVDPRGGRKVGGDAMQGTEAWLSIFLYSLHDRLMPRRRFLSFQATKYDLSPISGSAAEVTAQGQCGARLQVGLDGQTRHQRFCHGEDTPSWNEQDDQPAFLIQQIPWLVRGLELSSGSVLELPIRLTDGRRVQARLRMLDAHAKVSDEDPRQCELIEASYAGSELAAAAAPDAETAPHALFGELPARELYCRGLASHRPILTIESGNHRLTLVEEIRSAHWEEDFYPRLRQVTEYP